MHVAAGLDISTLTLFGDIDPTVWRPYSKKAHVIKSLSGTVEDLTPQEVAGKALQLIS